VDSGQQSDIFSMFHQFLQHYWSPDRMGMQANSFQEMINSTRDTVGQVIPGLGDSIGKAQEMLARPEFKEALGPISDIFGLGGRT